MSTSMVAIDGDSFGKLLPRTNWYRTIKETHDYRRGEYKYDEEVYNQHTIASGKNLWSVASVKLLPDEVDVRAAMTALLSLDAAQREQCFKERVPDRVY